MKWAALTKPITLLGSFMWLNLVSNPAVFRVRL
jgi:hypothetical protein